MIRDIGTLQWKDPLAWMESMKGAAWLRTIKKENQYAHAALDAHAALEGNLKSVENQFKKAREEHTLKDVFEHDSIFITPNGTYSYTWRWKDDMHIHEAGAVTCIGDTVWAVEADKEGKEIYTLSCYKKTGRIWHSKTSVGPYICIARDLCYVVEATSILRYGRCVCLDSKTGIKRRVLYSEPSLQTNLSLIAGEGGCVFLRADRSGYQALYHINGNAIERIGEECVSFVPVGYGSSKEPCFFGRIGSFESSWSSFGRELSEYFIPVALRECGIDHFSLAHSLLITSAGGARTVYICKENRAPEKINKIIGTVCAEKSRYIAMIPGSTPSVYDIKKCLVEGTRYASFTVEKAKSADGTMVPYILVKPKQKTVGLLVSIYGAYGIPTTLSTGRWKPYLDAGWAIAFGLIRGGGDFGDSWADAARTNKKSLSVDDTDCVIRAAQQNVEISWKKTCLYGRSAGGYTLGALVAHHGRGGLVGAAYAEVPYVDVLRTTTNPFLPLTVLEYEEFGNPVEKLEDLETILQLSPVDALPEEGAPGIFVVARTSLNDREVLPYESIKWITRLRGFPKQTPGEPKYLFIGDGQGHFVRGVAGDKEKAEDFLLLNLWLARV
jgi:Prolyl oligopeptidase family